VSLPGVLQVRRSSLTSTKTFVYPVSVNKKQPKLPKPTPAELEILGVLWRSGPTTVRSVHSELERTEPVTYTTVLKLMQIMTEKGLLERDESERAHIYRPTSEQADTQGQIVRDVVDRVFGGSAAQLVMRALSEKRASPREIDEIRQILDEAEKGGKR
jgi:BlaI family transcriptional regulator, penicillinase repressor